MNETSDQPAALGGAGSPPAPPPPPSAPPPRPPSPRARRGARFFDSVRRLGVVRPGDRRWAAGVCAGVGDRLGVDPLVIRGILVALSLVGGLGLLIYGVLWALLPDARDGRISAEEAINGEVGAPFVAAAVLVLADLAMHGDEPGHGWPWPFFGWGGGGVFITALVLAVLYLALRDRFRTAPVAGAGPPYATFAATSYSAPSDTAPASGGGPYAPPPARSAAAFPAGTSVTAPPEPKPRRARRRFAPILSGVTLILAAVASVVGWVVGGTVAHGRLVSGVDEPARLLVGCATALVVVGIGLIIAALRSRWTGLGFLGVLLAVAVLVLSAAPGTDAHFDRTATWAPTSVTEAQAGRNQGAGRLRVDLRALAGQATPADTPVEIPVNLGAGRLTVVAPSDATVEIKAQVGAGDVDASRAANVTWLSDNGDSDSSGRGLSGGVALQDDLRVGVDSRPDIVVQAQVGLGSIQIVTEGASR